MRQKLGRIIEHQLGGKANFARLLGVTTNAVTMYVSGATNPSYRVMEKAHAVSDGLVQYHIWFEGHNEQDKKDNIK